MANSSSTASGFAEPAAPRRFRFMPTADLSDLLPATQWLLVLAGAGVLCRYWRGRRAAVALPPRWEITPLVFAQIAFTALTGGVLLQGLLTRTLGARNDVLWNLIVPGGGFQFGILLGALLAIKLWAPGGGRPALERPGQVPRRTTRVSAVGHGILLFAATLPLIYGSGFLWVGLLDRLHIAAPKQELVGLFARTDDPWSILALSAVAVVLAPITEELVFRAGLFGFLRGRTPRWVALLFPAALFAALHANLASLLPLFLLGISFSLAYERTGRLLTSIVAHGLFNLNTLLLVAHGLTHPPAQ